MSQKLTGPALIAYLRDNPTSDAMRAAADEIERLRAIVATCARVIKTSRDQLELCEIDPCTGRVEDQGARDELQQLDGVLAVAFAALAHEQGGDDGTAV